MDVVYIVRPGELNEELRFSLRALANVPHDRVWIVGHRPEWVTGVGYLPTRQVRKLRSAPANILTACITEEISDPFLMMNDDFFVACPVDEVPITHRGPLDEMLAGDLPELYKRGLRRSADLLTSWGFRGLLAYDHVHTPMPIHKQAFAEAWYLARFVDFTFPTCVRTLYGNFAGLGGEQVADVKIRDRVSVPADDALFVSTDDDSFRGAVGQWIRDRFPDPSPYEVV